MQFWAFSSAKRRGQNSHGNEKNKKLRLCQGFVRNSFVVDEEMA